MFDTMTLTKAGGALTGSLLVLLLVKWGADVLYNTRPYAAEGEKAAQAYSIDTGATNAAAAADSGATQVAFADLYASADPAAGEKVFGKCKACHKVDGTNGTGPNLDGVVGRPVASVAGFGYSEAMKAHGGNWDPEVLDLFLANPKGAVPGTKMSFAGLPKAEDRANVIKYLASLGG
ncbi:MAG: c-type cytochrome [Pseudomonadota bacterium]